jgi:hypothetical protein
MKSLLTGMVVVAALALPAALRAAGIDDTSIRVLPVIPACAVNPDGTAFYVSNDKGNVEAIDLGTGKLLWDTEAAYRPLAVAGTRLIAQARVKDKPNSIRLVLLDLKAEGKLIKQSDVLDLPDSTDDDQYTSAQGGAAPGLRTSRSFNISASVEKKGAIITWRTSLTQSGRINQTVRAWGSWRLDLDSAETKQLTRGSATRGGGLGLPRPGDPPAEEKFEGDPDPLLLPPLPASLRKLLPPVGKPGPRTWHQIWALDGSGCLLLVNPSKDNTKNSAELTLYGWDATGKTTEPFVLHDGTITGGFDAGIRRTSDGGTIMIETGDKENHHLLLFAAATGKRIADLKAGDVVRLLPDGKTLLHADLAEKEMYRVHLVTAATGQSLGDINLKYVPDLKTDQIAGIAGSRVYTVAQTNKADGGPPNLRSQGSATLMVFNAASGEMLWKKSFNPRTVVDNTAMLAP